MPPYGATLCNAHRWAWAGAVVVVPTYGPWPPCPFGWLHSVAPNDAVVVHRDDALQQWMGVRPRDDGDGSDVTWAAVRAKVNSINYYSPHGCGNADLSYQPNRKLYHNRDT